MTWFKPEHQHRFAHTATRDDVHQVIDRIITSDNLFCALRIERPFSPRAHTRTVPRQTPTLSRDDRRARRSAGLPLFNQREGVLVGFRTPQHMQGINVAGYHEHFITDDRQGGGHLLDYQLESGVLTFGEITS